MEEKKELKNQETKTNDTKTVVSVSGAIENNEAIDPEVQEQLTAIAGDIEKVEANDAENVEILSEEVVKDKLEEVASATTPKKKKKNNIASIILLIVNVILVYLLASSLIGTGPEASFSNLISSQGSRLNYLWGGVLCFLIVVIADTLLIATILKTTTKKSRLGLSYKASSIGKYYEAITPFCAGGQPAQIVYLSKRNVSPGIATSVPIIRVTLINFATIFVSIFLFVVHIPNITGGNGLINILIGILEILAYVGLIINTLYFLAIFIIANSKVVGRTLARTMVKVGYKLRIFKNYRTAYKKIINQVTEYRSSVEYLKKHIWTLLLSIALVLIEILALASIPFFVTLGLSDLSFVSSADFLKFWVECLVKYYICYFASAYIPLPGGTGMMEISFIILFSSVIGPNFIAWGFLIWRIIGYYSTIVQGFIITLCDIGTSIFRKNRLKS